MEFRCILSVFKDSLRYMRTCFQNVGIREVGGDMERDRDRGRDIVFTYRKNTTCF